MTNNITLRKTAIETIRYTCTFESDTYFVDIIRDGLHVEAWLTRKNVGRSDLMWGSSLSRYDTAGSYADFLGLVSANLEDYIDTYEQDLIEDEERFLEKLEAMKQERLAGC